MDVQEGLDEEEDPSALGSPRLTVFLYLFASSAVPDRSIICVGPLCSR